MVSQLIQKRFSIENDENTTYGIKEIYIANETNYGTKYEINKFSISKTMFKYNFYELPNNILTNANINKYEKEFSKIESSYATQLNILLSMLNNPNKEFNKIKKHIEDNMLEKFLKFYFRTYQFLGVANDGIEEQNNENLRREEMNFRYLNTIENNSYLNGLERTIKKYYKLHILESLSEDFLLSDSFISTASLDFKGYFELNRKIGFKNILILIPISARYYLLYTDDNVNFKNNFIKVYNKDIDYYNAIIYRNSCEFTIGKHLETLKRINENVTKYGFGFNIIDKNITKLEVWADEKINYYYHNYINSKYIEPKGFIVYDGIIEQDIVDKNDKNYIPMKLSCNNHIFN